MRRDEPAKDALKSGRRKRSRPQAKVIVVNKKSQERWSARRAMFHGSMLGLAMASVHHLA